MQGKHFDIHYMEVITMKNMKTKGLAGSLIVIFSLLLSICMYVLSVSVLDTKSISNDYFNPVKNIIGAPTAQIDMQKKFNAMNIKSEEDGKKTIILFSGEKLMQIDNDKSVESEKILSLSTEEILFIIDDSIKIYNEYDKIVFFPYDYNIKSSYFPSNEEIIPIRDIKDTAAYYKMCKDIYNIIMHRVLTLTSSKIQFLAVQHNDIFKYYNTTSYDDMVCVAVDFDFTKYNTFSEYMRQRFDPNENIKDKNLAASAIFLFHLFHTIQYQTVGKTEEIFPTAELETLDPSGKPLSTMKKT